MKEHVKQERFTCRSGETDQETISYESASKHVPVDLFNHLAWMLFEDDTPVGENGRVPLTESQQETVLNIAQDVLLQVTGTPMPKHIGLALYILKQTGSKDLVRICNKFGQCISYDVAQRYITTWANDVESVGPCSFIPHGLVDGVFTQYAFDNLDFHENTKDGTTLHATTHNIYQYTDFDTPDMGSVPIRVNRERSLPQPENFVTGTPTITLKDRQKARSVQGFLVNNNFQLPSLVKDDFFVWSLMRLNVSRNGTDDPTIPKVSNVME